MRSYIKNKEETYLQKREIVSMLLIFIFLTILLFSYNTLLTSIFIIGCFRLLSNIKFIYESFYEYLILTPLDLPTRYGKGTYALITGGANGIGREFATQLSTSGFNLILIDLDHEGLLTAKEEIIKETLDTEVIIITQDLSLLKNTEDFKKMLKCVLELDISILVNNVGIVSTLPFHEASPKIIRDIIQLNSNCFVVFQSILYKQLLKRTVNSQKKSAIINISSESGYYPYYCMFMQSSSKSFSTTFTSSLSSENQSPNLDIL
mmetsp:Transcript_30255/g.26819  ORF Transcript_30255/g.26819 Transcript_30255/m.26819 type:complete len:263 (+) Transcript_30255:24-812(+)